MTELEFARAYFGEYTIKGEEIIPKLCPFCRGGQHGDKETFALNMEKHTYNCMRGSCGAHGHFAALCQEKGVPYAREADTVGTPTVRRVYRKPLWRAPKLQGPEAAYVTRRKISLETAAAYGVGGRKGEIVFPYFEDKQAFQAQKPVFLKYRPARKLHKGEHKARREKDTKPVLFGMHLCDPEKGPLTLFEGEFDCLAGYEAGGINCVSVPSGCADFTWLETCAAFLSRFPGVLIMADHDEAGLKMLREAAVKLEGMVYRPDFDLYQGCKDANEILYRFGAAALRAALTSLRPVETLGLLNLAEVQPVDIRSIPRVLSGTRTLDRLTGGLYEGDLNVWTGKRGEGKSTYLTQLLLEALEQGARVCAYSGEIPADRLKYTVCLQAAGGTFLEDVPDERTGRIVQAVPKAVMDGLNRWFDGRFWLYDNRIVENDEAESVIRVFEQAYRRYNCRVFLVDNLMCVRTCRKDADYYQMQADFSIRLRKLAEKLGVVIHLVAHPRKSKNGALDSDDVGGLSVVTNIACNVFSLKRVEEEERETVCCDAILRVLKNRAYGELGDVRLTYLHRVRQFVELDQPERVFHWIDQDFIPLDGGEDAPF